MTPPRRAQRSEADVKAIVEAVVRQIGAAYLPSTGGTDKIDVLLGKIEAIDLRLSKIEEQTNEHLPLIKSLHAALSTGKGFAKFLAWLIGLAAASATAWTAIKALFIR